MQKLNISQHAKEINYALKIFKEKVSNFIIIAKFLDSSIRILINPYYIRFCFKLAQL